MPQRREFRKKECSSNIFNATRSTGSHSADHMRRNGSNLLLHVWLTPVWPTLPGPLLCAGCLIVIMGSWTSNGNVPMETSGWPLSHQFKELTIVLITVNFFQSFINKFLKWGTSIVYKSECLVVSHEGYNSIMIDNRKNWAWASKL